jgi:hypothetical protein
MNYGTSSFGLGTNLLVAGFTTLLMLGVLELLVRTFVPVRDVGPTFTVYDPIYEKRLQPNFHATRIAPEFRFEFNTNSLRMRDPEPRKPVTEGIVFVGDSFTMGYGVQDDEAFPALVRAALEKRGITTPVLNTGLGNSGNGRWVKFFDHDAAQFRPRIVVFEVMENDFDRNLNEHLYELDANGQLRELPVGPPSVPRKAQMLVDSIPGLSYSHLIGLVRTALTQPLMPTGQAPTGQDESPTSDALTYALVRTSVEKARAMGARVLGLLVGLTGQRRAKIAAIFEERGLHYFDGPLKKDAPNMFFKIDGHWNAAGHRRAAQLILPEIVGLLGEQRAKVPVAGERD